MERATASGCVAASPWGEMLRPFSRLSGRLDEPREPPRCGKLISCIAAIAAYLCQ
jgi:hypothetical protein